MRNYLGLPVLLLIIFSVFAHYQPVVAVNEVSIDLVINEFMPNPEGSDGDYEWIELYNYSSKSIDLTNFSIDGSKLNDGSVGPMDYVIIANNKESLESRYTKLKNVVEHKISLKNSSDIIELHRNDKLIEEIEYEGSNSGKSIERIHPLCGEFEENPVNHSISILNNLYNPNDCENAPNVSIQNSQLERFNNDYVGIDINEKQNFRLNIKNANVPNSTKVDWYINDKKVSSLTLDNPFETTIDDYEQEIKAEVDADEKLVSTVTIYNYPRLYLNEIFPNPIGQDNEQEWIEISGPVGFSSPKWILADLNTETEIDINLNENGFGLIYPEFSINNNDEKVKLMTPEGLLVDTFDFEESKEELSHSKDENREIVLFTKPTPNALNIIDLEVDEDEITPEKDDESNVASSRENEDETINMNLKSDKDILQNTPKDMDAINLKNSEKRLLGKTNYISLTQEEFDNIEENDNLSEEELEVTKFTVGFGSVLVSGLVAIILDSNQRKTIIDFSRRIFDKI